MKFLPYYIEYFISPITGRLSGHAQLPSLTEEYVWEGNVLDQPIPSPILIDMRLQAAQLKNQVDGISESEFIIKKPNKQYIPNAQSLSLLETGLLKSTTETGTLSIAIPFTDYMAAELSEGKIWIGNSENIPVESSYTPFDSELTFIVKTGSTSLPNAQALDVLPNGVMINTGGVISTSDLYVKYSGTSSVIGNIAIFTDEAGNLINDGGISVPGLQELVDEAEAAAEAAEASAGEASASATEATIAAGEASISATEATIAAGEASASAGEASIAAIAAAASAVSASSSASDASDDKDACDKVLADMLATGVILSGEVSGTGTYNTAVVTTLNTTLDAVPVAVANVNLNNKKITSLANGTNMNDAVNYGQLSSAVGGTVATVSGTTNRITSTGGINPIIDISAAYAGQTSIVTLGTVATGTWSATNIALNKGGTNASLTASNGGIFYSTASAGAILEGTALPNQLFISGASGPPSWTSFYKDYGTSGLVIGNLFAGTNCGSSAITNNPANTGFGVDCLDSISASGSGGGNSCLGYSVFKLITTAGANTGAGFAAGAFMLSGNGNSFFGSTAGYSQTIYNSCTLIGSDADTDVNNLTNASAIGAGSLETESNSMTLGNTSLIKLKTTAKLIITTAGAAQGIDLATADSYANFRVIQNTTGPDNHLYLGFMSGATSSVLLYSNNNVTMRVQSGNVGIGGASFGGGTACLFMANAAAPTSDPAFGGLLYVSGGALKYRGSSGTVTNIANA